MVNFAGNCDYVLARGRLSPTDSFSVSVRNVPCGTSSVTCGKAVRVVVGGGAGRETVRLVRGGSVEAAGLTRLQFSQAGLYLMLEAADLGLAVQWDRANRLYLRLDPRWRGLTEGLCGNYNGAAGDDLVSPAGLGLASHAGLGDSWRLQSYCPAASPVPDTCSLHPHRRQWATQKCGVLRSDLFRGCRR